MDRKRNNRIFAKRALALVLCAMLALCVLTGCGSGPTAEDAQNYTKAVLDMMCLGDYDHSVKIADIEEGQESALRDEVITEAMDSLGSIDMSDEVRESFKDVLDKALSKCKYTVGDAVGTPKDGYDVTVTIEPVKLFDGLEDALTAELSDLLSDSEKLAAMSEREINDVVYSTMIRLMSEKMDNPSYGAPEDVTVHYGQMEQDGKKVYGISEADGEKLGEMLFSTEGLE